MNQLQRRGWATWAAFCLLSLPGLGQMADSPLVGPPSGSLVIVGGGRLGPEIVGRFLELAGGPDAPIVVVPTAGEGASYAQDWNGTAFLKSAGATRITVLHTRDRAEADREEFVQPIREARGVWFSGGRQWRLVDSYLGTLAEREFHNLLARGGVIGGTSAGATIQGSYLVRGAREGNQIMMAPGYEQGFGFLRGVAVDQHLLARNRQEDLVAVIRAHPGLLGIGLDESTAIVVHRDRFQVIGVSKVAIYDRKGADGAEESGYYFLSPGEAFDLRTRSRIAAADGEPPR